MAHRAGKDIYRKLGKKIDGLTVRAPWNQTLYRILKELYTPREAEILVRMPDGLSSLDRMKRATRMDECELLIALEDLCEKGLVFDVQVKDKIFYAPAPMVVGIFEMTMMRTRGELRQAEWARLFHEYLHGDHSFYAANFGHGERTSVMRALPHEVAFESDSQVEILDYEKATSIIENTDKFSIGLCSCRHEKLHVGEKSCETPLETCSSFGNGALTMVRHGFARQVSRHEMLDNLARAKELKLTLTADNVQKRVGFMCFCCGCCCNLMLGVRKHGYPNTIVTSSFISQIDAEKCTACEKCAKACPIQAIQMVPIPNPTTKKTKNPIVDENICLGCGVCALACHKQAVTLTKRAQRVLHPETTFERVILQSLERGNLQNMLFAEPEKMTHQVLRGLVGGFLRLPPVNQALMSDSLRSRFLAALHSVA